MEYLLFKSFIWDEYIVNNSAVAALDGVGGQPDVGYVISDNQEIAIKPYEERFYVYAVSKGFWGWSVTDEPSITDKKNKPFEIIERTLQFKKNKSLIYLLFHLQRSKSIVSLLNFWKDPLLKLLMVGVFYTTPVRASC